MFASFRSLGRNANLTHSGVQDVWETAVEFRGRPSYHNAHCPCLHLFGESGDRSVMSPTIRKLFPYMVVFVVVGAMGWALSFGTLPKADFSFNNGTEPKTIDPAKATGSPEGRIINALFEGLLRDHPLDVPPDASGLTPMEPRPAMAESFTLSEDGRTYTFKIRPTARWSNGEAVTADDFVWSWRRFLHPATACIYAYQLYYLTNAEKYNTSVVEVGDVVEVELPDRPDEFQPFPRGTLLRGELREIIKPPKPEPIKDAKANAKALSKWKETWAYVVAVNQQQRVDEIQDIEPTVRVFCISPPKEPGKLAAPAKIEPCLHVLIDFDTVGVHATDKTTLVVQLNNRTPFFTNLVAFYPLHPVNRRCVEKYGTPNWTKAENLVNNGPFNMQFRRLRDRVRLVKNPEYWNAENVALEVIDALAVPMESTSLNMYLTGQLDWSTTAPSAIMPELSQRDDFVRAPMLTTYFYRVNVNRPPLDNPLVRKALNRAIDKSIICEKVTKGGQIPARSFVPPGLAGFKSGLAGDFNPEEARKLLAEAGYPGGRGLRKIQIVYNTNEGHKMIAEVIAQQWHEHLNVEVELRNLEWGVFLNTLHQVEYDVARSAWIADYPDPNTFLDMFVTDGGNNETGFANPKYDQLIADAASEPDAKKRMEILHDAEELLMDELPIIPIYFYVSVNMVSPRVKNFTANLQDVHPLHLLRIGKSK